MADNKQPTGPEEHIAPKAAAPDMPGPVPEPELAAGKAVTLEQEKRAALNETDKPLTGSGDNVVPFAAAEAEGRNSDKADKLGKGRGCSHENKKRRSSQLHPGANRMIHIFVFTHKKAECPC